MKSMHKLLKRKKSKLGTAVKILIPVAGVIAAKKLWDNKEALVPDCVREKVLEKTENVTKTTTADDSTESGEDADVTINEITEETLEQTEESNEENDSETEKSEKID